MALWQRLQFGSDAHHSQKPTNKRDSKLRISMTCCSASQSNFDRPSGAEVKYARGASSTAPPKVVPTTTLVAPCLAPPPPMQLPWPWTRSRAKITSGIAGLRLTHPVCRSDCLLAEYAFLYAFSKKSLRKRQAP